MSVIWTFDGIENKHDVYRESLREHAMKIMNFEKKKMIPLTNEQQESYEKIIIYSICKKKDKQNTLMIKIIVNYKNYRKVKRHHHFTSKCRGAAHSICNLKYNIPKENPVVSHNGLHYDYHFIIKEPAEDFERKLNCLGESTEKYKTFSFPTIKEVTRIDKNRKEVIKNISCKLKFVDSARFIPISVSNLVDNFAKGIHKIKCKNEQNNKKCKTCGNKYKFNNI